ncbi:MAG TPA: PEP-CTERM sorting domain-containing protein [Pyrinomonadaceae bacterium]|nr:PEP-CTERM sorting domain-containing protein [Pyrinomonadaceae bacterium]
MSQTTHAGPVLVSEVVQTVNTLQSSLDLRLRNLSQDPVSPDVKGAGTTSAISDDANSSKGGAKADSILSGVAVDLQTQNFGVVVVEEAIVEGTVCDCGEILLPGAGFPKWPLLFLAAIPLIFIPECDDCDVPVCVNCVIATPTPTPPPPNSTVPEPASLFLFGTGLLAIGAGLRRRYAKAKFETETQTKDE